ncbi:lycopene cyclase family protein [Salegentibacter flavus]|uniref:Lycopene beta-cyclase n=1 Tax=Salegentibacter flavus TaxID=287099 RepID=A0A1I5D2D7_9FLAO|nr:lycopene cyclase family protein [Salegentibacter flavus]SFN93379.1 lycopene beta-cyclase [Salegentibacter flavus]
MQVPKYFYVIVGGGLAGLQLARQLSRDIFFKGKQIAVIDPDFETPTKTWCFWEKGKGQWDDLVSKTWKNGRFITSELNKKLELEPYQYKMIKAKDFYREILQELEASNDIKLIRDEISEIDPVTREASGKLNNYSATHFFDSRVDPEYLEEGKHTLIYQHFKGWEIETPEPVFSPEEFTMMDYRLKYKDTTAFTYVLPVSKTKALIEFTFFTPFLTEDAVYDKMLKRYLGEILKLKDYNIKTTETGIIPMTDFPFEEGNTSNITKIGTGGGWVKASTGYSFINTQKRVSKIVENLKSGKPPGESLINKKFKRYDGIFLDVLANNNEKGEEIFTKFYTKNTPEEIFSYLDEETTFSEDLKIMMSLYSFDFIKSFFRKNF